MFLEEREKEREISPLFSLSLSVSDEKKSTDTKNNKKVPHTNERRLE